MNKLLLFLVLTFLMSTTFAGTRVYNNMYLSSKNDLLQGIGKTTHEAKMDALSAMPEGYAKDPSNSPTYFCLFKNSTWETKKTEKCINKSLVGYIIPILKL